MENNSTVNLKIKQRNPNIDCIRIAGMFSIIIDHLLFHGKAITKYNKYNELQLLNILCMWHVSSFGIISGIVGNKAHKFSNLFYLWIMAVFYCFIFYLKYSDSNQRSFNDIIISNIFPIINNKYWYFTSYFGIYPFLPFINSGISILSRIQVKKSIYFMIGIFIIMSSYYRDVFSQNSGHSPFSLLIFYIIGTYFDKYIFYKTNSIIIRILICIFCFTIFIFISLISYNINIKKLFPELKSNIKNLLKIEINSFPMLIQTCSITLFIAQIKFNKIVSKIITFIGPLTFDAYLIHENPLIRSKYISNIFSLSPNNLNLSIIIILIFKNAFLIFTICIFIAYIRNILFKFLKIKIICNYFEIIITKIIICLI